MTSCRWRASPARTPCSRHAETPETSRSTTIGPREASRVGNRPGGSPIASSKPPDPEGAPGQRASSAIRRAASRTTSHTGPWPAVDGDVPPNRRQARRKRRRQPRRRAPPQGVAKSDVRRTGTHRGDAPRNHLGQTRCASASIRMRTYVSDTAWEETMTVTPAGHGPSITGTGTGAGSVTGLPPSAPEAHSYSATNHPAPRVRRTRPRRHDAAGPQPPDNPVLRPHHDEATLPDADLLKASADHSAWRQDETGR